MLPAQKLTDPRRAAPRRHKQTPRINGRHIKGKLFTVMREVSDNNKRHILSK